MRSAIKRAVCLWLACFARAQLAKLRPLVIAVGGASGKTSTVSAIVAALEGTRRTRSGGGQNSESGVPLGILGIRMDAYGPLDWLRAVLLAPWRVLTDWAPCDVYVAEYGVDHPGDMGRLLGFRVPDVAAVTSVGLEHAGYWPGTTEEVLAALVDEELRLLEAVPAGGVAVAFVDDPRIRERVSSLRARVVTVGSEEGADVELTGYAVSQAGTAIEAHCGGFTYAARLPHPASRAGVSSMILAAAVAHQAGVPLREAFAAIARAWQVPPGRGRVFPGKAGRLLIDSTYNATPLAMADALRFLADLAPDRRRVAVLGDMRELGEHAKEAHEALVPQIAQACDRAILVGPLMGEHVAPRLSAAGFPVAAFGSVAALLPEVEALLEPGDAVLLKGSQNTLFLERVTERLLADPRDAARLARRARHWEAARAASR